MLNGKQQEKQGSSVSSMIPGFMGIGSFLFQNMQGMQAHHVQQQASAFIGLRDRFVTSVQDIISTTDPKVNTVLSVWIKQNKDAYPGTILTMLHSELKASKEEEAKFGLFRKSGDWATYRANLEALIKTYPPENILSAAEALIVSWSKLQSESDSKTQEAAALQSQVNDLTATNQKLREEAIERDTIAKQNAQIIKDLQAEVERLKVLADRKVALEEEVSGLRKQLDTAGVQLVKLEQEKDELKAEKVELKVKAEANTSMQIELAVTKSQLDSANKRVKELEDKVASLEKQMADNQEKVMGKLESLIEKSNLNQTVNASMRFDPNASVNSSMSGENSFHGGNGNARPQPLVPREVSNMSMNAGTRGANNKATPFFAVPAPVQRLEKSATETTEVNAGKIAVHLKNIKALKCISDLRINTLQLLLRFLSHFNPDDQNTPECFAVIEWVKKVVAENPSSPKTTLEALNVALSQVKSSEQCAKQFKDLKADLSSLSQTATPRAQQENLGNYRLIGEIKNLMLPNRYNVPVLNTDFAELLEQAKQAETGVTQLKEDTQDLDTGYSAPNPLSTSQNGDVFG